MPCHTSLSCDIEGPLGFPMKDKAAQELDALLKQLPKEEPYTYSTLQVIREPTEIDKEERTDVSWITTEATTFF